MRYGRRLRRYSGLRGLRRRSPLLEHGRYSRYSRSRRFYSAEKETEAFLAEFAEGLEQVLDAIEETEAKAGAELRAEEKEVEKEIEGESTHSRIFSSLAYLRLYNVTAEELADVRALAGQLSKESLETLLNAYVDGDVPQDMAESTGLASVLERIKAKFKYGLKFVVKFVASVIVNVVPFYILGGLAAKTMHWMLTSKPAVLFSSLSPYVGMALVGVAVACGVLALFYWVPKHAAEAAEATEKSLLLEDETNLRKIAVVLAKAQTLLKDAKFNRADRNKLVKFINENRATLEDLAARIEEAQHQE